jgi:hypothetical protein
MDRRGVSLGSVVAFAVVLAGCAAGGPGDGGGADDPGSVPDRPYVKRSWGITLGGGSSSSSSGCGAGSSSSSGSSGGASSSSGGSSSGGSSSSGSSSGESSSGGSSSSGSSSGGASSSGGSSSGGSSSGGSSGGGSSSSGSSSGGSSSGGSSSSGSSSGGATSCAASAYDGRAIGVSVLVDVALPPLTAGASVVVADTGELPASGGQEQVELAHAAIAPLLTTDAIASGTASGATGVTSSSSVDVLGGAVAGIAVAAQVLSSDASATCGSNGAVLSGSSVVTGLVIGGVAVLVTGAPNQTLDVGPLHVVIDETSTTASAAGGNVSVNALHITAAGIADVVVSHAAAGVSCACKDGVPHD